MPREREIFTELTSQDYQIDGNVFRVWRDENRNLICILDETIDEYKPYALLVLGSYGERKWDDVLQNDYNLDLETVRPKKNNKYQKLDIEYDGLKHYAALISAYDSNQNLDDALTRLYDFRDTAVRRAAAERLVAATDVIEQASKTAMRAERSITALQNRRNVLEKRLVRQRESIGREPAKESASKILRTESQMEKNTEKIARSKKRLDNAMRRGEAAREDADVAREVLSRRRPVMKRKIVVEQDVKKVENNDKEDVERETFIDTKIETETTKVERSTAETTPQDVVTVTEKTEYTLPVPDYEINKEPEETKMPDTQDKEEVKPLLDQDPEILDDEIAFKPVAFEDIKPSVDTVVEKKEEKVVSETESVEPISKPLALSENQTVSQSYERTETTYEERKETAPVLNTIQSVEPSNGADVDTTGRVENTQYSNIQSQQRPASPNTAPMVNRPISPITGSNTKVKPVGEHSKPTILYYLLLIVLIALSIFTLWLYQKKNGGTVPFLNQEGTAETTAQPDVIGDGDIFIKPEPVQIEPEPEPDVPVIVEPEPVPEPVPEPDTPINVEYPNNNILYAAEPEVPVVESEDSVLSRKDPYAVSREDQPVYVPEPRVTNVAAPDVIMEDNVVSVPILEPGYVDEEEMFYNENGEDAVYYQEIQPQQVMYDEYVDEDQYAEDNIEEDGGFIMESNDSETHRYLSVHDGGQYSVGYTEETY